MTSLGFCEEYEFQSSKGSPFNNLAAQKAKLLIERSHSR